MSVKQPPKLIDQIRLVINKRGYSKTTKRSYIYWIKRYILFHKKTAPQYLYEKDIGDFITSLFKTNNNSYNTQRIAISAIFFLYEHVLLKQLGYIDNIIWAEKPNKLKVNKIISTGKKVKSFLCYASDDKESVIQIYKKLKNDGSDPWMDTESILPGQDWALEIEKAVRKSNIVIVCLSQKACTKSGFVQKEIKFALDVADEQPEGTIFIIPLKLEECNIPFRLQKWQWVEFYKKDGYSKLIKALNHCAKTR